MKNDDQNSTPLKLHRKYNVLKPKKSSAPTPPTTPKILKTPEQEQFSSFVESSKKTKLENDDEKNKKIPAGIRLTKDEITALNNLKKITGMDRSKVVSKLIRINLKSYFDDDFKDVDDDE